MPERKVNRGAWAEVISQLIAEETAGNKSRFAHLVGVTYKTVVRWLNQEGDISEESVSQVADAVHISPIELMLRVGYYRDTDLPAEPLPSAVDTDDPALRVILEAGFPPRIKMRMIKRLEELRAEQRKRELDDVRWWIDQVKGA